MTKLKELQENCGDWVNDIIPFNIRGILLGWNDDNYLTFEQMADHIERFGLDVVIAGEE